MEVRDKFLEQAGNLFTFINSACESYVDRTHDENGAEHFSFKLRQREGSIKYAYTSIEGLCSILETGAIDKIMKPMEDFLSLRTDKVDEVRDYIEKYGFFTTLPKDRLVEVDIEILNPILKRLQILVQLFTEVSSGSINYNNLLSWVLKLLMAKPMMIELVSEEGGTIQTAVHPFTELWFLNPPISPREKPVESLAPMEIDLNDTDMEIQDTFTGKTEKWDIDMQSKLDFDLLDTRRFNNKNVDNAPSLMLRYLYLNCLQIQENGRKVLDFLYHFSEEISPIISTGEIDTIKVKNAVDLMEKKEFTDQYKTVLLEIAKDVIKCEIDMQLQLVRPIYDIESMSANWEIDNRFAAMYLSLFYMRPKYEIYRRCENPNCNRFFKVSTTNSKRKYHDLACQNAAAQWRHRKKKNRNKDTNEKESTPDD